MKYNPSCVRLPVEVPEGALHCSFERPARADERASLGRRGNKYNALSVPVRKDEEVKVVARDPQGPGRQDRAGVTPEVGHPRRAHYPGEGERHHRRSQHQPLQGCHHQG
ncbi:hypothetical protein MUK42_14756 [Musa troglodytarum]|uniref:Uncharacterized protein n=1 Tax=Musa troglodytarum TaxID=320322 RepID=A0A9E7I6N3_9LILI|nr:hypothetical protein MUK42_14756 [Musa troglodytarum]